MTWDAAWATSVQERSILVKTLEKNIKAQQDAIKKANKN